MSNQPTVSHFLLANPANHDAINLFQFCVIAIEDPVLEDGEFPVLVGFGAAENLPELDLVIPFVLLGPAIYPILSILSFHGLTLGGIRRTYSSPGRGCRS